VKTFLFSNPAKILDEKYDRLAILLFGLTWVFYSYTPHLATHIFRPAMFHYSATLNRLWIPGTLLTVFYLTFPQVLKLDSIGKIITFGFVAVFGYAAHFFIKGFGIIDFSWFGFYYGNIGVVLLLRAMQRRMLSLKERVEADLDKYDKDVITELKKEWSFLLSKFLQVCLAAATILGVCMSILLSGVATVKGVQMPSWEDWARMQNAIRMAFLFFAESGLYFLFFIAPIIDVMSSYQSLLISKYDVSQNVEGPDANDLSFQSEPDNDGHRLSFVDWGKVRSMRAK